MHEQLISTLSTVAKDGAFRAGRGLSGLMGQEIAIPAADALLPLPVGGRTAALVYLDREPENLGTLDPVALRELLAAAGDQLAAQIRRRKAGSRPASGR